MDLLRRRQSVDELHHLVEAATLLRQVAATEAGRRRSVAAYQAAAGAGCGEVELLALYRERKRWRARRQLALNKALAWWKGGGRDPS